MGRIWAVASGNGGTGKTTIALSLAAEAARKGNKTIFLDASGQSRSSDLILGLENIVTLDLVDVLSQQIDLKAALYSVQGFENLSMAYASLAQSIEMDELSGIMLALQSMCDILIIDLPTGILPPNIGMMAEDDAILVVLRPDDASIRAAERVVNSARCGAAGLSLVLNHVQRDRIKKGLQHSQDAVMMTLDCPVIASIQEDDNFAMGIARTKSLGRFLARVNNPLNGILSQLLR